MQFLDYYIRRLRLAGRNASKPVTLEQAREQIEKFHKPDPRQNRRHQGTLRPQKH